MAYLISEAAEFLGVSVHTLRYYDRIGLLEGVARDSRGRRSFTDHDLLTLETVECLKRTGMPLEDIRRYVRLTQGGMESVAERLRLVREQLEQIPAGLYRDGVQYYGDTHYHPNSQSRYTVMSLLGLMDFDVENQADLLDQPLLMIAGDISDTRSMTDDFFAKATGTSDKHVVYIKGANHIETYWNPEFVRQEAAALLDFFGSRLKNRQKPAQD